MSRALTQKQRQAILKTRDKNTLYFQKRGAGYSGDPPLKDSEIDRDNERESWVPRKHSLANVD